MKKEINFSEIPESDVIINHINQRYKKGLYSLILVTGLPGTGKSSFSLRVAELVSERIHSENRITEKNVVDSFLDFLKILKDIKEPGVIIDIEEVSVLFPTRRAMAIDNVNLGKVLDTCRKKRVIIIANAPIFKSIESHMRTMSSILVETMGINKSAEVVIAKTWRLQTNPHSGKTYRHTFQRKGRDISKIYTKKPRESTWENYENKKDEFITDLYVDLEHSTQKKKDKKDKELGKKNINNIKRFTQKELDVHQMVNVRGLTQTETAKFMGVTPSRIGHIIKNILKKGNIPSKNHESNIQNPIMLPSN